jgi:hypothetical protein
MERGFVSRRIAIIIGAAVAALLVVAGGFVAVALLIGRLPTQDTTTTNAAPAAALAACTETGESKYSGELSEIALPLPAGAVSIMQPHAIRLDEVAEYVSSATVQYKTTLKELEFQRAYRQEWREERNLVELTLLQFRCADEARDWWDTLDRLFRDDLRATPWSIEGIPSPGSSYSRSGNAYITFAKGDLVVMLYAFGVGWNSPADLDPVEQEAVDQYALLPAAA